MALTVFPQTPPTASGGPSLTTTVRSERARTVLVLAGEADVSGRAVLSDALSRVIAALVGDVVVDLSALTFIDSGSVRIFAITRELLDRQGRKLSVRSPSKLAISLLRLWGLGELIELRDEAEL
ncbi:MAG: STAS domain-containing protein [Acidimicrobiales bacterium]